MTSFGRRKGLATGSLGVKIDDIDEAGDNDGYEAKEEENS